MSELNIQRGKREKKGKEERNARREAGREERKGEGRKTCWFGLGNRITSTSTEVAREILSS